ncbi:mechanosensitive ion channel family protein [Paracoccus caeni]|uniref:Mechanosensitive ion channel family protein n=1 Tax=Paracoccus caeni TaxID=657651 RepID=A0A934SFA5_9RHOB|nr:DUF3772 domain-containing protein [Paracoccus caeni]MBK4217836.1 mechanosensitive ion channel family protein [Paracoccus caeni]
MLRALLAVLLTVFTLLVTPVVAQESQALDYDAWNRVSERAERLLDGGDASDEALSSTRDALVQWRGRFQDGQNVNGDRIGAIRQQIEALGPPPAEGASEDEEIANRRGELNKQLSELQSPRLAAVEALSQVNSLIGRLDEERAERQAQEMARLAPSPLLPSSWSEAGKTGLELAEGFGKELVSTEEREQKWQGLRERLPAALAYIIGALALLTLGRRWIGSLPSRLSARATDHSRAVVAFITSLGQIAIPMLGVFLLIRGLKETALPGPWTTPLLDVVPQAAVILFSGLWLGRTLFPRRAIAYDTLQMREADRNKARRMTILLSVTYAVHYILAYAILPPAGIYQLHGASQDRVPLEITEASASVWHFALILVAGLALFRLGTVLRALVKRDDASALPLRHRILSWAGMLTRIVIVIALLFAATGFINLGNLFTWPWALSIALIGVLILLQDFTADLFSMLKRGEEGARDGLIPLLIGFLLVLLSIPLFMVIWGSTGTDLSELWTRIQTGMSFGGIRLSPGSVLTFVVVFTIGYMLTRGIQGGLKNSILPKTRIDAGGQNAVVSGVGYVGIFLAGLMAVTSAGIDLSSIAIVAGALSVGIGFGLQNIVSNFVSGIILLIERPVSVGDWIDAGGQQGIVKRISVRSTEIETFDRTEVIVPNSDLISQPVTNWTRHSKIGRIIIPVGVSYDADTRKVAQILRDIIEDQPLVTIDPAPSVLFRGISVDTLNFEIRAFLSDIGSGLGVTSEVYHQIVERFKAEGIGVPFTTRDNWSKAADLPEAGEHGPADPTAPEFRQDEADDGR